ncbi:MAG: hypothetical protein JW952_00790, partial [Candidatus Eisenbacteria bacterium]|nr:hypothetical protein [Candidatus Eisenbacteria bacterium]
CTCADGIPETCDLPCTNVIVQLQDGTVYDSLYCPACDLDAGSTLEYRATLNGVPGSWVGTAAQTLTAADGLKTGWNTVIIEAKERLADGRPGRTAATTRQFYVDVEVP